MKRCSFKLGDTLVYDGPQEYGESVQNKLLMFICEHKPQRGHITVMDIATGKLYPMYHTEDFRRAKEEEC